MTTLAQLALWRRTPGEPTNPAAGGGQTAFDRWRDRTFIDMPRALLAHLSHIDRPASHRRAYAAMAVASGRARRGDREAARKGYERALDHWRNCLAAHAALGRLLLAEGAPEEAARLLQRAVRGGHDRADILADYALALSRVGRLAEAEATLDRARKRQAAPGILKAAETAISDARESADPAIPAK